MLLVVGVGCQRQDPRALGVAGVLPKTAGLCSNHTIGALSLAGGLVGLFD